MGDIGSFSSFRSLRQLLQKKSNLTSLLAALDLKRRSNNTDRLRSRFKREIFSLEERRKLVETELIVMGWQKVDCRLCKGSGATKLFHVINVDAPPTMCLDCSGTGKSWVDPLGVPRTPGPNGFEYGW